MAVLVNIATIPSVTPRPIDPVSPIKNLAGFILNQRKASNAPTITAQNVASSCFPEIKAIVPKEANAAKSNPPANPSNPSDSFTEKPVATIIKIKIGIYHKPISKLPIKGIRNKSQSNL